MSINTVTKLGLSPRVRGNPPCSVRSASTVGSIPARAGEPLRCIDTASWTTVYPRACGGTKNSPDRIDAAVGLSPRVRGNQFRTGVEIVRSGSIPARAGEPCPALRPRYRFRVYPRACGGTDRRPALQMIRFGLSPRVRGNRPWARNRSARRGSIPARAGEPQSFRCCYCCWWVYPRACGGTPTLLLLLRFSIGLSPRVRGNRKGNNCRKPCQRSIPARAGEPIPEFMPSHVSTVYPRACGGTATSALGSSPAAGLSPRVRGNRPDPRPR